MRKILIGVCAAFVALAGGLLLAAPEAGAQGRLPIPSSMCSAGQIPYAVDANNLACTSSPAVPTNLTVAGTTTLGSTGTAITTAIRYTADLTPTAVSSARCAEQTATVTGVGTGELLWANGPAQNTAALAHVRVSASNTVSLAFCNPAATSTTPASGTYTFFVVRF